MKWHFEQGSLENHQIKPCWRPLKYLSPQQHPHFEKSGWALLFGQFDTKIGAAEIQNHKEIGNKEISQGNITIKIIIFQQIFPSYILTILSQSSDCQSPSIM